MSEYNEWIIPKEQNQWQNDIEYLQYLRHLKAYDYAKTICKGKRVLEVGCGSGYGAKFISTTAFEVVAIDKDDRAISLAASRYSMPNITYLHNCSDFLPFANKTFDVVISFQVIEHIKPEAIPIYMNEVKRVLRSDGIFLITTANRKLRLLPFQRPWNPYHVKEYSPRELRKILKKNFSNVRLKGLRGVEIIERIERNRVRQSPFQVYIRNSMRPILRKMLPKTFIKLIKQWLNRFEKPLSNESLLYHNQNMCKNFYLSYSLEDLWFQDHDLKKSIDILGICKV